MARVAPDSNDSRSTAALSRVLQAIGGVEVVERLAGLSGSDFTTVMLDVARRRAAAQTPATVLRRYRSDRFVQPGGVPWRRLRRAEDVVVAEPAGRVRAADARRRWCRSARTRRSAR